MNTVFLDACFGKKTSYTPVWYMRQAGRYLPEYRKLKEKYKILEIVQIPELAAKVALQPVDILDVDAAILFADIMIPLLGIGVDLEIVENIGPVIKYPIRKMSEVKKLRDLQPEEDIPYLSQTIKILNKELANKVPLIGFSAAPFTLASYLIEGKPTRDFILTKSFMYNNKRSWNVLMQKLTDLIIVYLQYQVASGVQALQLFDSWVGYLSASDYQEYVLPYTRQIFTALHESTVKKLSTRNQKHEIRNSKQIQNSNDQNTKQLQIVKKRFEHSSFEEGENIIPLIHFGTNTAGLLSLFASVDCDVVSVDWRVSLDKTWKEVGLQKALQGNLDPVLLLADFSIIKKKIDALFLSLPKREGYIFNLGHGVLPTTPVNNLIKLTEYVHQK